MTASEIREIILVSAQSNVLELEFQGLRLKFGERGPAKPLVTPSRAPETTRPAEAALSDSEHTTQTQESILEREAEVKRERLALMQIEDPLQYEKLVASGELEDEGGDGAESTLN